MSVDLEALTKVFPREAIKRRQGGKGKWFDYVEGHAVIHRLNDATGNNWSFRVKSVEVQIVGQPPKQTKLLIAIGELEIPGHGVRSGMGVQMFADGSGEDLAKGVLTDCLKKCATLFGVALELYGPDYEGDDDGIQPQHQGAPRQQPPADRPPQAAPQQEPASDDVDWIAQINAAMSPAACAEIGNAMIKARVPASHPAKARLRQRVAELNGQLAESVGAQAGGPR